jgi:hypothetical protein
VNNFKDIYFVSTFIMQKEGIEGKKKDNLLKKV